MVVVAVAAALALAFALGANSVSTGATATVDRSADAVLEQVDLAESVGEIPSIDELRGAVATYDEPDGVTVTAGGSDVVTLDVAAPDESAAGTTLDALEVTLSDFVEERRAAAGVDLRAVIDADIASLQQQLAATDQQLASNANGGLADVFLLERQNTADDLALAVRRSNAVDRWVDSTFRVVTSRRGITQTDTRVMWAVVGLVVGALAAVAWIVARAQVDRRVWSRADLAAAGVGPILPIVPTDGPEREVAVAGVRQAAGDRSLVVVAADTAARPVADDLVALLGPGIGRSVELAALHDHVDGSARVLLTAAFGSTPVADVVRGVEYVGALGADLAGVVVGGVSERGARRAEA